MARVFHIETATKPSALLARAKKTAHESGATFVGDERSGSFSHEMLKGDYRMVARTVIVTVTDKHLLLPWAAVESGLNQLVK